MPTQFYKRFFSLVTIIGFSEIWMLSAPPGQAESVNNLRNSIIETHYLAQSTDVLSLLKGLPQPKGIKGNISELFSANSYGQQALNFQASLKPEEVVSFYQDSLTAEGYSEREVNRTTGAWGFNLVFDQPDNLNLSPTDTSKSVVLVLQGTMLDPNTININVRFEEI